ncbi:ATP-binding protein [Gramella sp. AN32]|uniref:histidine kinase n=1 Tax=Christiangramia antarctica TaxID=2058158 RepID=A0ABW5WY53_9FLAO|nr:ATP-binding protein [Gramella sp. AN32]MCM4156831.1 hypothetical protein [Gramella sp. AN32]
MINFKTFTTFQKIASLIVTAGLIILLLFAGLFYFLYSSKKENFSAGQKGFNNEISSLLTLKSEPLVNTITDLTYWDVFVAYFNSPNQSDFYENIGSTINPYDIDFIGAYSLDGTLLNSISSEGFDINLIPLPAQLFQKLYNKRGFVFYEKLGNNVIEIYAATVHPTSDFMKSKTNPSGFLVLMRVLDSHYYDNISSISSASLKSDIPDNTDDAFFSELVQYKNFNNEVIDEVIFVRPSYVDYGNAFTLLYGLLFVFLLNVAIYLFIATRWVKIPLKLIRDILKNHNQEALQKLENSSIDFKEIAVLFKKAEKREVDLEEAKIKAEESDKLKSSFLANLSHEIRTPMNAILGFSELLEQDKISKKEKKEYLRIMKQSGSNLISIIDDLIEMSKIDVNQITPNKVSFRIDTTMAEIIQSLQVTIPKTKPVRLNLILPRNPIDKNIIADDVKIRQILTNLISNALKFTEEGCVSVTYGINEQATKIYFSVKDTGRGISLAEQDVIFERFRQVENNYTSESGGLGLGLAISRAYVEIMGGSIKIESQLGVGTTFSFSIPFTQDLNAQEAYDTPDTYNSSPSLDFVDPSQKLILVAEDDNINFMLIKKLLTDMGFKSIRAVNGIEAVEICKTNSEIDLVIMDIKMPFKDGFEARREIISFAPDLPMLAHTAFAAQEDRIRTKEAGFVGHIAKPLKKDILLTKIQQALYKNSPPHIKQYD